jgi:branched-chain amino acid transport system permease protein
MALRWIKRAGSRAFGSPRHHRLHTRSARMRPIVQPDLCCASAPLLRLRFSSAYHPIGGTAELASMIYQQVINGLMLGASYALVAIGYTLIFGVLGLLYFAHGEIFMVGAFVGLYLVLYAGANIWLALLGATIACAALGVMAVYVAVRPVPKDRPLAPLISTIGLTIILQNLAVYIFGGQQVAFPETIKQTLYTIGPITISSVQLFILGVAVALMVALWLFIERTKMGRAIRATAENHETAALLGVDVNKVIIVTFIIGSGIAGIAGVLDGIKNSGVSPFMGLSAGVKGLIVMLLGGLGNVFGAMVAGLMLGMIEILSAAYIGTTERDLFSFLILILILIYKPTGLFGTRTADER